jgi:DNA-binding response OmpR family regulator
VPDASTILLVDDEEAVQKLLTYPLEKEGFRVIQARDGEEALGRFSAERVDLVVLDIMLPKLDGLEVCKRLRAASPSVPIIMLTARDDELDKVLGLELGADDYITKPFSIREFRSRVRALLRRAAAPRHGLEEDAIEADGLRIDVPRRSVEVDGKPVQLTYVEFELLRTLAANPGRVFTRQALLEALWGGSQYREPRTIDVHVRHLREKLERNPAEPELIFTVRGVGYRFRDR